MNKLDIDCEQDEIDVLSAVVTDDQLENAARMDSAMANYTYGCTGYYYCPGTPAID